MKEIVKEDSTQVCIIVPSPPFSSSSCPSSPFSIVRSVFVYYSYSYYYHYNTNYHKLLKMAVMKTDFRGQDSLLPAPLQLPQPPSYRLLLPSCCDHTIKFDLFYKVKNMRLDQTNKCGPRCQIEQWMSRQNKTIHVSSFAYLVTIRTILFDFVYPLFPGRFLGPVLFSFTRLDKVRRFR